MLSKTYHSFGEVLQGAESLLGRLCAKVQVLQQLDAIFKSLLCPELVEHCHVSNFERQRLVIGVDSAAWATRIRYEAPTLVKQLRSKGMEVISIHCKVEPLSSKANMIKSSPRIPKTHVSGLIEQTAEDVKNEALKSALARLAKSLKQ